MSRREPSCETCRFWEWDHGGEVGTCHRFPPFTPCFDDRGLADVYKGIQTLVFVETFFDDWCGEWCGREPGEARRSGRGGGL